MSHTSRTKPIMSGSFHLFLGVVKFAGYSWCKTTRLRAYRQFSAHDRVSFTNNSRALLEKPIVPQILAVDHILWNPKIHHRVHKSPPLAPLISIIQPTISRPVSFRSVLTLHFSIGLSFTSGLSISSYLTKVPF